MDRTFRIAVCNLQTGIGTTRGYWQYLTTAWKYALPHGSAPVERAVDFLEAERIDLAVFSEIEGGSRRTRGVDQVRLISESTQLEEWAFFPTLVLGGRVNQGNAVCSRFPTRHVQNHPLPGIGEPRFMSEAGVTLFGIPSRVFATHLSLDRKVRTPQIQHLAERLREVDEPVILSGDFNIEEDAELELLSKANLEQAASAPTFPSWNPKKRLDHLFLSEHFTIADLDTFDRILFSDHLPLIATLVLNGS